MALELCQAPPLSPPSEQGPSPAHHALCFAARQQHICYGDQESLNGQMPFLQLLQAWALIGLQQVMAYTAGSRAPLPIPTPGPLQRGLPRVLHPSEGAGDEIPLLAATSLQRAACNAGTAWAKLRAKNKCEPNCFICTNATALSFNVSAPLHCRPAFSLQLSPALHFKISEKPNCTKFLVNRLRLVDGAMTKQH